MLIKKRKKRASSEEKGDGGKKRDSLRTLKKNKGTCKNRPHNHVVSKAQTSTEKPGTERKEELVL